MKATLKSVAVALTVLAVVMAILIAVDGGNASRVSASKTYLRVSVVDLDGTPVHNAQVTVNSAQFNTDNKGLSPAIELAQLTNCYDGTITDWGTVTVTVKKSDYVPAMVFNCVVYTGQNRKLTVKIYPVDGSDLPYTIYVESPPDDYVKSLL